MFCRYCGKELADDAIFCDACGKKLHDDAETVQKEPVQQKENSQVKKPKKKLFVVIGVVLALIILIGAVFFIGYGIVSGIEVKMPDPVAFFDVEGEESESEICIYTKENPLDAVWEYIEYLDDQEEFDLLFGGEYRKGEDFQRFVFEYNDKGDAAAFFDEILGNVGFPWIEVSYGGREACGCYSVAVKLMDGGKFVMPEARTSILLTAAEHDETHEDIMIDIEEDVKAESDEKENTETAVTVDPDAAVLPDFGAFIGNPKPVKYEATGTNGRQIYYELQIDEGWQAGIEFVELLKSSKYNFELTESFSDTTLYLYDEFYFFEYTGSETIEPVSDRYWLNGGYHNYTTDIYICVQRNGLNEYTSICIVYSADLSVQDFGDRASTVPQNSDGSSDMDFYVDGAISPDFNRPDCLTCNGSGDCTECGGYGTIKRYNGDGDYIDSSCPQCNGRRKCRTCNGSGKR